MILLSLLFNRRSWVVRLLAVSTFYFLYRHIALFPSQPVSYQALSGALALLYLFTLFCRVYPWYTREHRGHGIDDHFAKIYVAGVYVYSLSSLAFFGSAWTLVLALGILFILYPVMTNIIVLVCHLKDSSTTPPGYHSRGLYK